MIVWHCYLRNPNKFRHPVSRTQIPQALTLAADIVEAADRFRLMYEQQGIEAYDISVWMGAADFVYDGEDGLAIC